MLIYKLIAIFTYIVFLLLIAGFSYKKNQSSSDYIIGGRSMNFFLTALAAHASDMSSWLLMGYPAVIFSQGFFQAWIAIGLVFFMFLNWQFIAPKIRKATEKYNSMTLSSFFESRFNDTSGTIRILTALMLLVFYTIYISAGLIGLGLLIESIFHFNYFIGITVGIAVVIPYLFVGGYVTLAWTDLFQGLFLMLVCLFVPIYVLYFIFGNFSGVVSSAQIKHLSLSLFPNFSTMTFLQILGIMCGWGLGYFGQPHIITKFMGINKVSEMKKAQWIGLSWQIITLAAATLIGLLAIHYYPHSLPNSELVFITMVNQVFPVFFATFILCAIFAATISTMDSQILVLASTLAEDIYKRIFHKNASSQAVLKASRLSVFIVSILAYIIAFSKFNTIFSLVSYAWSGLGATFGPILILGLYTKTANKYGAWTGILLGGFIAGFWPYVNQMLKIDVPPIIPGFFISFFAIWLVSYLTQKKGLSSLLSKEDIKTKVKR